jgi:hypothetical protein
MKSTIKNSLSYFEKMKSTIKKYNYSLICSTKYLRIDKSSIESIIS